MTQYLYAKLRAQLATPFLFAYTTAVSELQRQLDIYAKNDTTIVYQNKGYLALSESANWTINRKDKSTVRVYYCHQGSIAPLWQQAKCSFREGEHRPGKNTRHSKSLNSLMASYPNHTMSNANASCEQGLAVFPGPV